MNYLLEILEQYINYTLALNISDLLKLIDVVNLTQILPTVASLQEPVITSETIRFPRIFLNLKTLEISFFKNFTTDLNFTKIFFFFNLILVKILFLRVTSTTFWLIPSLLLFLAALVLLFSIKPSESNKKIWIRASFFLILTILYQASLIYLFINFSNLGYLLKVGASGALNLPFNLALSKLISILVIFITLFLTLVFYWYYYSKVLYLIKPEFCSVILFLGFGSNMIFLQNDLFSIFLYFEIISFCIYGLLFLHKRTNSQLHALIWYVLFSLWVSTCYIIGLAFYLLSNNSTTSLLYFKNNLNFLSTFSQSNNLFDYLIVQEFETILAIIFILIYFLFKLGAGPFYTWTIEVYNSCSTGSLLAVSLIPKLIYFPMLFFILFFNFFEYLNFWSAILGAIGLLTTIIGSLGIIITDKLKEIYAWSSIVHTGNLLVIVSSISSITLTFLIFYLISYYLISFGFIVIIMSLQNRFTGKFIKTISELNSINTLNSTFFILAVLILASAAGFTPFLSFFMKFSLLSLVASHYGLFLTLFLGLINIIASIAYLWMLRNIIGFNVNNYNLKSNVIKTNFVELNQSYEIAWLLNCVCLLIVFSFIYYKDFINLFSFYSHPFFMGEEPSGVWWLHF